MRSSLTSPVSGILWSRWKAMMASRVSRVSSPLISPGLVIVEERGLRQVTDTGAIEAAVDAIMAANADKVAEYRGGKEKLFGFFVGQTMKAMAGKGNPALVNEVLKKKLA